MGSAVERGFLFFGYWDRLICLWHIVKLRVIAYSETCIYSVYEKVLKASDIVWFLSRQWAQLRKQKDARKAHGNTQCEHLVSQMESRLCDTWNRGYVC